MKPKSKPYSQLATIRTAVADYIRTEGCECCRHPKHGQHKERLAKLLRIRKYSDGSGYDFSPHETK